MVGRQRWYVLHYAGIAVTSERLIHVGSHCRKDLVLEFRSRDVGNFGWKSLLRAIGGELTSRGDCCSFRK